MRMNSLPVSQARRGDHGSLLIGQNGEINATDKNDLARTIVEIANRINSGELAAVEDPENVITSRAEVARENRQVLKEAFNDRNSSAWAELGAAISSDVRVRIEREGFMRTVLAEGDLQDGSIPRIRVRQKNVTAIASRGVAQVYPQYVRETFVPADEFYVTSQPRVEEKDLVQSSGDLLDDKYFEGLEAMLVAEDRTLVKMFRAADGINNDLTNFSGSFTPSVFGAVKRSVDGWRIPVANAIIAMDLLTDITTGTTFGTWFDPISKWEIIRTGRLGNLLGVNLMTDGFRDPELRVLNDGEFFLLGTPEYLGGYTERYPVQSRPVDEFERFVPARGWSMWELISMVVANSRAVARGQRIG